MLCSMTMVSNSELQIPLYVVCSVKEYVRDILNNE